MSSDSTVPQPDLLKNLSVLVSYVVNIPALREREANAWRAASLATSARVECVARSRGAVASAIEAGLPVDKALDVLDKHGLLDGEEILFLRRQLAKETLDTSRLPMYLRKATIPSTPGASIRAGTTLSDL